MDNLHDIYDFYILMYKGIEFSRSVFYANLFFSSSLDKIKFFYLLPLLRGIGILFLYHRGYPHHHKPARGRLKGYFRAFLKTEHIPDHPWYGSLAL